VASSTVILLATTSLPTASTTASYITRARHIASKFDGDLFRLYAISAQATMPPRIIKSTHLLRMSPMLSPPGLGGDFEAYQGGASGGQGARMRLGEGLDLAVVPAGGGSRRWRLGFRRSSHSGDALFVPNPLRLALRG
jgi:hypothetical protein